MEPRYFHRQARGRRRAVERSGGQLPAAGRGRERNATGRRRRGRQPARLLRCRIPLQRPGADADHAEPGQRGQPGLLARVSAGAGARLRGHQRVPFGGRFRQARSEDERRHGRPAHGRAGLRRLRPDPRLPLLRRAGRRLRHRRLRLFQRMCRRDARPAAAVRDLRSQRPGPLAGLGPDAAAALALGQLQPVLGNEEPVRVRRPRAGVDRDHPVGARAGRLVLRPCGRRELRSVGGRRRPLQPRSAVHRHRRVLDGRLRHLQVHESSSPTSSRGPSPRSGRRRWGYGFPPAPPTGGEAP